MTYLPTSVHPHLKKQLDWDHEGVDIDLCEIAKKMQDWEQKISAHMNLTRIEINDIKIKYSNQPLLQR